MGVFGVGLLSFVVFISIVWGVIGTIPELADLDPRVSETLFLAAFLPSLGWGMTLFFQLINLLIDSGMGERQIRAQAFARVMSLQMMDTVLYGSKQKREDTDLENATVGPDGEIEYFDDEQQRTQRK